MGFFARLFVKIVLLVALLFVFLFNYKFMTINNGIHTLNTDAYENDAVENIFTIALDMQKIYYYKNPWVSEKFCVIFETEDHGLYYFSDVGNAELEALKISAALVKMDMAKASIMPWWLYIIFGLIILFFPKIRKKQS